MRFSIRKRFTIAALILLIQCTGGKGPQVSYKRVETNIKSDIRSLYEQNNENFKEAISLLIMSKNGDIPFNLVEKISSSIVEYSLKYDFDPLFITTVIYKESEFNPFALSPVGAAGLMQLLPKYFDANSNNNSNIYDIETNIEKGVSELYRLREKYQNYPDMLMAYLAGETALRNYKKGYISEETAILMNYYSYIIIKSYQILSGRYRHYINNNNDLLSLQ